MNNPFVLSPNEYNRDLDIVNSYIEQNALYIHMETGDTLEDCVKFVKNTVRPGAEYGIVDPDIHCLEQVTPGNREKVDRTFLGYIKEVIDSGRILSPSMVCYEKPSVVKSVSAAFIEGGINDRKKAKKEMFVARQNGDLVLEYIKDCEQNSKKIGINSVSGMHGFSGNVLYVKSGHSSLTSMCRTATGYGNATNEKLIAGSRHYWHVDIVIANILTTITRTNYLSLDKVMESYGIVYPTVEDTMACIERSTSLYWRNDNEMARIQSLVEKMDRLQRAAFVYIGDVYHLAKLNDALVRGFMDQLICEPTYVKGFDVEAAISDNEKDDDLKAYVNLLAAKILDGRTRAQLKEQNPNDYIRLAAIAKNVKDTLLVYSDLIRALWVPTTLPPTVANIRNIVRRTAIASDTDSTIFTTQDWVTWYTGTTKRSTEGDGIWYTMTYIATQCIIHVLAQFSANMGVDKSDLHRLSMKNEYAFPVFSLTSRAKHYYAYMSAREGNVYKEYDHEIKGVALRSSAVPPHVIKRAKELMFEVLTAADEGKKLSLKYVYGVIYEYEQDIINSIKRGESKYLKTGQINEQYKNMESSPYQHYLLWETVFAPKYGSTVAPPYNIIKVPLDIENKTAMVDWLKSMKDTELSARFADYMLSRNRDKLGTIYLPTAVMTSAGMPEEIMMAVNVRKLTYEILSSFYLILESLGVFQIDENFVRLVSDVYSPDEPLKLEEIKQ